MCDSGDLYIEEIAKEPDLLIRSCKVKINGNRWDFLEQCFGNHYLAVAGDVRSELKLLCKWLGVSIFET